MAALRLLLMSIVAVITIGEVTRQTEAFIIADLQRAAEQPLESTDHGDRKAPGNAIDDLETSDTEASETEIVNISDTEDAETAVHVTQLADIIEDAETTENDHPLASNVSLVDESNLDLKEEDDGNFVHDEVHYNRTITPLAGIEDVTPSADTFVDKSILDLKKEEDGNLLDNEVLFNRTKRDALECGLSPEGVTKPCLVCDGSRYVFFTDINGHTCKCEVCRVPKYMEVPCLCTPNGEVESGPQCSFPTLGEEYMNVSNFCDRPKKCSQCEGNLEVKLSCTLTSDTKCGCPKNTYQTGHNKCDPIPPCRKNFEIHEIGRADSIYNTYECLPCEDGFIQPNDNSLDRCRPIEEKDTTEVPPDDVTVQKEHFVSTPTSNESWNKDTNEPRAASSTKPESTHEFNCPPDYCPPSCFASEPQDIRQPEADAVESRQIGCNDTVYDDIDDDYANEQHISILPSTFIEHPFLWLGLGTVIIVVYLSSVMIALVYGSKNKKKVRRLTEVLRINKWLYRKPDPEFPRSEDPGENPHPLRINLQNTQNPQYYNYQNTNANETQLLTSEQEGTLINDDTGDQRRKSNRVLLRERRTDSTNVE